MANMGVGQQQAGQMAARRILLKQSELLGKGGCGINHPAARGTTIDQRQTDRQLAATWIVSG